MCHIFVYTAIIVVTSKHGESLYGLSGCTMAETLALRLYNGRDMYKRCFRLVVAWRV